MFLFNTVDERERNNGGNMLIKVAIVDDEPEIVQSLTDLLVRYQTETPRGGGGHSCVLLSDRRRIFGG